MSLGDTFTLSLVQMNSGPDRDANIAQAAAHIDRAVETERARPRGDPGILQSPLRLQ